MTTVAIHQPQYLPYPGFFHKVQHSDLFVILDDVQYQRRGVQNRNKIKTDTGWNWLTVPVVHHSREQLIKDVLINKNTKWEQEHWKTLRFYYSPTPFFKLYSEGIKAILDTGHNHLSQLNMALIEWVMSILQMNVPLLFSSQLEVTGEKTDRLINICQAVGADCYLSGAGGRNYMDLDLFASARIQVVWQQYETPIYRQHFSKIGFIPDLSIMDALFNCGPDLVQFLR